MIAQAGEKMNEQSGYFNAVYTETVIGTRGATLRMLAALLPVANVTMRKRVVQQPAPVAIRPAAADQAAVMLLPC